jgi:hypothetical protein
MLSGAVPKSWQITLNAAHYSGTTDYNLSYEYECAVNIKHADDKYCTFYNYDGADPNDAGSFSSPQI